MKEKFYILTLIATTLCYSQENKLWKGYFSYNSITDISQSSNQIFAASENAYFKKKTATNETTEVTTIEGLSGQTITQIYHSETFKKTIIGHDDGFLIVVNDTDGSVLNVVDILNKPSVPQNKKRINHLMENDGKIYIATDFGISVFDLSLSAFRDTYFIGAGGSNAEILQTTVFNGFIYAAVKNYGILKADLSNPNIIDFNQWLMFSAGAWFGVEKTSTEIIGIGPSFLYKLTTGSPVLVSFYPQNFNDVRYINGKFIITSANYVIILNDNLVETLRINNTADTSVNFTCATIIEDKIYIGTREKGVLTTSFSNSTVFENITPNGPLKNSVFAIQTFSKGLWAVFGDYNGDYNPYPLDAFGISKYDSNNLWTTTPHESLFNALSISRIAINPNNENEVYFSSYFSGLLKFENGLPSTIFNTTNSSLQSIVGQNLPNVWINGSAFDKSGNLWVTNSLVSKGLHVLKTDGQWVGYSPTSILYPTTTSYGRLAIDKNGTKWMTSNFSGLIGFNENYNNRSTLITQDIEKGNLPSRDVRAVAIDNKNKLWIGTTLGLRVLQSTDSFLTQDVLTPEAIIIVEDGLAQELLYQQFITDIVVDGANNKWIGTAGAGVFYISSDGQQTFNIFTKENSPLPSNFINDIDINSNTGEVFIATSKGMVSYKGFSTIGSETLDNVVAFPNPVRPEFNGIVSIAGLTNKANVKITDIEGNLVHEAISEGGTVLWDTKAFGKYKVATGVYMVFVSTEDGLLSKTKKIMIIR